MFPNTWQELPRKWARSSPFLSTLGNLVRSRSGKPIYTAYYQRPDLGFSVQDRDMHWRTFDPGNTHKNAVLKWRENSKKSLKSCRGGPFVVEFTKDKYA